MLLKQAKEFDNFSFGTQSIVIGRTMRHSQNAVEDALVLEIYRRYSKRVFVFPFQVFHFSSAETSRMYSLLHQGQCAA